MADNQNQQPVLWDSTDLGSQTKEWETSSALAPLKVSLSLLMASVPSPSVWEILSHLNPISSAVAWEINCDWLPAALCAKLNIKNDELAKQNREKDAKIANLEKTIAELKSKLSKLEWYLKTFEISATLNWSLESFVAVYDSKSGLVDKDWKLTPWWMWRILEIREVLNFYNNDIKADLQVSKSKWYITDTDISHYEEALKTVNDIYKDSLKSQSEESLFVRAANTSLDSYKTIISKPTFTINDRRRLVLCSKFFAVLSSKNLKNPEIVNAISEFNKTWSQTYSRIIESLAN